MNILLGFSFFVVLISLLESLNGAVDDSFRERAKKYCRLEKKCKKREVVNYTYGKLIKISDIVGVQPIGYLVRFPFYVMAPRDAWIVFAADEKPRWPKDKVYEVLIGGWGNNRTSILRKRQSNALKREYTIDILDKNNPLSCVIEVTTDGKIRVFLNDQKKPVVEGEDDGDFVQIKYFGFASYDNSLARFFYGCEGENAYGEEDIKTLCQYTEVRGNGYNDFYKISDITGIRPDGYIINFPFYIRAERDAKILLTTGPRSNPDDSEYEIVIGGKGNAHTIISRKQSADVLRDTQTFDLLSGDKWIAFLIQITTSGNIKVFRRDGFQSFTLIGDFNDPDPIKVEYISFDAGNTNAVQFYFNCSFGFATPDTVSIMKNHPLLREDVPSAVNLRNFLTTKCNYYTNSEYDYTQFVKISDIANASPDGYILRVVFYVQGDGDAYILLATSDHPVYERDSVYEFVLGGSNKRVMMRKKRNGNVISEVFASNVINTERPTKFLLEVANSGNVRLHSQTQRSRPIISVFEGNPLPIQYISFAGFEGSEMQFFYNCNHIDTRIQK